MKALINAIKLAADIHAEQLDKAGKPYILHPLHVMLQMDTDFERIVAVLHDVLEDSDLCIDDLCDDVELSDEQCEALYALTRLNGEEYPNYINRVSKNPLAIKVKMSDLQHNLDERRESVISPELKSRYRKALNFLAEKAA